MEIMLWYPVSCYGEASMVVVCGVHGYIYNTNPTVNTSWWNIYVYKISIKKIKKSQTLLWRNVGLWVLHTHFLVYIYIYIYIYIYVYSWHVNPLSNFHVHIYTCWHMFSLFIQIFFCYPFFFQGRKRLTFFEHVLAFIICRDEFDFR